MFPIQSGYSREENIAPHPTSIPWSVADKAYSTYRRLFGGSQSLERLSQRGGFSAGEMDMFHPTWREEASEVVALQAKLAAVTAERDELKTTLARVLGATTC